VLEALVAPPQMRHATRVDAGTAAILGAVVGALGTGGAATLTGLWNSRITQRQVEAQERQSHRQLRFEHLRDRREPRSKTYGDFLAQARAVHRTALGIESGHHRSVDDPEPPSTDDLRREFFKLDELVARVQVEGPHSMVQPAREVVDAAYRLVEPLHDLTQTWNNDERTRRAVNNLTHALEGYRTAIDSFAEAARLALDDDGSNSH
jgi:hypothetical protein